MEGEGGRESLRQNTHNLSNNSVNGLGMNKNKPKFNADHIYTLSKPSGLISHAQLNEEHMSTSCEKIPHNQHMDHLISTNSYAHNILNTKMQDIKSCTIIHEAQIQYII